MSEQLYVALTPDGMYLKEYTVSTHAGYRKYYEHTSLNAADALPAHFWRRSKAPAHVLVPVNVSRIVTIITEVL